MDEMRITVKITTSEGMDYIGLVRNGYQETPHDWLRLERAVQIITVSKEGKTGLAMISLAKNNMFTGWIDLQKRFIVGICELDSKGELYQQYKSETSILTLPKRHPLSFGSHPCILEI